MLFNNKSKKQIIKICLNVIFIWKVYLFNKHTFFIKIHLEKNFINFGSHFIHREKSLFPYRCIVLCRNLYSLFVVPFFSIFVIFWGNFEKLILLYLLRNYSGNRLLFRIPVHFYLSNSYAFAKSYEKISLHLKFHFLREFSYCTSRQTLS